MFKESFAQSWKLRYGEEPNSEFSEIEKFLTHRSVRKFTDESISEEHINYLISTAHSAATSSNLQLRTIISIQDSVKREQIAKCCSNQIQIQKAPWFFGFFADHYRLRKALKQTGQDPKGLEYTDFFIMAVIDATLAAERMVCAAESLGLGTCYIGAFRNYPKIIKELLDLPKGVFGIFGLCLGWPDENYPFNIKPRLKNTSIWFKEKYDHEVHIDDYNERMVQFYDSEKINATFNWTMRSSKRVNGVDMEGREVLKEWFETQGFNLR